MADDEAPTYQSLMTENAALKATVRVLETTVSTQTRAIQQRDAELAQLRARRGPRSLDKAAPSAFGRPWDGR
jgi:hypothetical protein